MSKECKCEGQSKSDDEHANFISNVGNVVMQACRLLVKAGVEKIMSKPDNKEIEKNDKV